MYNHNVWNYRIILKLLKKNKYKLLSVLKNSKHQNINKRIIKR